MNLSAISPALATTLGTALGTGDPAALLTIQSAAIAAACDYRVISTLAAAEAAENLSAAVGTAKALLASRGVPRLTVPQVLAVIEALKLGNALASAGDKDCLPMQLLEVLVDTTGYCTVAENLAASGDALPCVPVWSNPAEGPQDGSPLPFDVMVANLTAAASAAEATSTAERGAAALVTALTA